MTLLQKLLTADVVCKDCGTKYGKYSVGCSSTWNGTCGVCGEDKPITEVRDWGYLTKGIHAEKAKIKERSLEVANYMKCQEEIASQETDDHPITPPPELVQQWLTHAISMATPSETGIYVATQAARWGADQELEALLDLADHLLPAETLRYLLEARRPKPPSLKEQALSELAGAVAGGNITPERGALIRLALEALPD